MSTLTQIQDKLQQCIAELSQLEGTLALHPDSPALCANIRSLQKLQRNYEAEWLNETDKRGLDVCSYRLFTVGAPTIYAMSTALATFQNMFSVVYDAIRGGPKERATVSRDVEQATSFTFGYTFPGSLGVVFSLPNSRLLPSMESGLDEAFNAIEELAHAQEPEAISKLAKTLGPAPIRATYRWAKDHADHKLGADIQWRRNQQVRRTLLVQQPQLERLKTTIEVVTEETAEDIVVQGVLVAVNTISRTFHLAVPAFDIDIRGKYGDAIGEEQRVTIPKIYTAYLRKSTRLELSTGEQKIAYFLQKLQD